MITVTVRGADEVLARLDRMNSTIRPRLFERMTALLIRIQSYVKANKLSGQVLNRRTGDLSRSIQYDVEDTPKGVVGRVYAGPNVPYAVIHEFGGTVTIPAHRRIITQVFGRPIDPVAVDVRSYTATFPERSFLRSTLLEFKYSIAMALRKALEDAAAGGGSGASAQANPS